MHSRVVGHTNCAGRASSSRQAGEICQDLCDSAGSCLDGRWIAFVKCLPCTVAGQRGTRSSSAEAKSSDRNERIVSANSGDVSGDIEGIVADAGKSSRKPNFESVDDIRAAKTEPIRFVLREARRSRSSKVE